MKNIDKKELKFELSLAKTHRWNTKFPIQTESMPITMKMDRILKRITKTCKKNYKEVDIGKEEEIWYSVLEVLYELRADPKIVKKAFC
jgi:hypothetical protein